MLSMLLGLSPQSLHQPHHPLASTTHPASLQGRVNTWTPINLAIVQENRLDFGRKPSIFSLVSADGPFAPGIIATHRNLKNLAHQRDRIFVLMFGHKLVLHPWP